MVPVVPAAFDLGRHERVIYGAGSHCGQSTLRIRLLPVHAVWLWFDLSGPVVRSLFARGVHSELLYECGYTRRMVRLGNSEGREDAYYAEYQCSGPGANRSGQCVPIHAVVLLSESL